MPALPVRLLLASGTLALLALAPAAAQDDDLPLCIQGNPCEVIVDVDAAGIDADPTDFQKGDWVLFTVFNGDDVNHTVTLEGHGFEMEIAPDDLVDSQPIELPDPGSFALSDDPTGDSVMLVVAEEERQTEGTDGTGIPGLAPVLLMAAFIALAAVVRRR